MRIVNLASGSKANATYVEYGWSKMLIDVGLNEKQLVERLRNIGEELKNILGVCITHEHVDHIRGLKTLAKKYDFDFYIRKELAESDFLKDVVFKEGKLHKIEKDVFLVGELEVQPFDVSHDAVAPVGFVVNVAGSLSKAGFVTDLGIVSEDVKKYLEGAKMVFIESNYDEQMLINGFYPYVVKQRINGEFGHLSNDQSLDFAKFLFEHGTKCFVLSHLSQNNNAPEIAYSNYASYFEGLGLELDKDVFIRVSHQDRQGNNFSLKEDFDGK